MEIPKFYSNVKLTRISWNQLFSKGYNVIILQIDFTNLSFQVRVIFSFFYTVCLHKQVLISRKLFDIENFHSKDKKANVLFMFYQEKEFLAVTFIPVCIVNMPNRSREQPISWNQNSFLKTLFRKKKYFFELPALIDSQKNWIIHKKNVALFA